MKQVQILADTCCDLTEEQLKKYGVHTIPLYVTTDDGVFLDGLDMTPDKLFAYCEKTGKTPGTSAATIGDYLDFFKQYLDQGKDIIYIGLSEKMSCTVTNARMAAEQLSPDHIFVIDSQNLSTGIGLLVIKAGKMAEEGFSASDIVAEIEKTRSRVRSSFVLDTLEYLRRGGRCSLVASVTASLLSLHPEIAVSNGTMAPKTKFRGRTALACGKYAEELLSSRDRIEDDVVFVTHTVGCDPEIIDAVLSRVQQAGFSRILISTAGCVISSHCGTNCIGFLFIEKE